MDDRAWQPMSGPKTSKNRSLAPFKTTFGFSKSGCAFTMPTILSHAFDPVQIAYVMFDRRQHLDRKRPHGLLRLFRRYIDVNLAATDDRFVLQKGCAMPRDVKHGSHLNRRGAIRAWQNQWGGKRDAQFF